MRAIDLQHQEIFPYLATVECHPRRKPSWRRRRRRFEREQKTVTFSKVVLRGQRGELPTVLIGSMFYDKDPTVTDASGRLYDRKRSQQLINR